MKTNEFRCEKCDKLLAKFTGEWEFGDSDLVDRTYRVTGRQPDHKHYLEIKCPRCKFTNKKQVFGDERAIGKRITDEMTRERVISKEALEAHDRVSRHGDNV